MYHNLIQNFKIVKTYYNLLKCYYRFIKTKFNLKINGAPSNNTAPANSDDKIFKNFIDEINSAQYYARKYGKYT